MDKIRVCPICFQKVFYSCYHDGEDIQTFLISEDEHKKKRLKWLDEEIDELEERLTVYKIERTLLHSGDKGK